jgi:hypothetical protein
MVVGEPLFGGNMREVGGNSLFGGHMRMNGGHVQRFGGGGTAFWWQYA